MTQEMYDQAVRALHDNRALMEEKGKTPLVQPRLLVCGREFSGKTTLIDSLGRGWWGSWFADELRRPNRSVGEDRTRGVNVNVLYLSRTVRSHNWWLL